MSVGRSSSPFEQGRALKLKDHEQLEQNVESRPPKDSVGFSRKLSTVVAHFQHERAAGARVCSPVPATPLLLEMLPPTEEAVHRQVVHGADFVERDVIEEQVRGRADCQEQTEKQRLLQLDRKSVV